MGTPDLPVLHHRNTVLLEQSALQSVALTSATIKEPHSCPGAPALMSVLMGGRQDTVKDKGLTLMFPLDIYSTHRKRPSFLITSLCITTAKSYLNGDGGCLYIRKMMSCILYIVYNLSLILKGRDHILPPIHEIHRQTNNILGLLLKTN